MHTEPSGMRASTSMAPLKVCVWHGKGTYQLFPTYYGTHRVAATPHFSEAAYVREAKEAAGL